MSEREVAILETSQAKIFDIYNQQALKNNLPSVNGYVRPDLLQISQKHHQMLIDEIVTVTRRDPIFITGRQAVEMSRKTQGLETMPAVVLGTAFYNELLHQAEQLWAGPIVPLYLSRGYLPKFFSQPVNYVNSNVLSLASPQEQVRCIKRTVESQKSVVIMDDNASTRAGTLRQTTELLGKVGISTEAYVVAFYGGCGFDSWGNPAMIDEIPIYAVKTRFDDQAEKEEYEKNGRKPTLSIETIDMTYFQGAGAAIINGYPEAENTLVALFEILSEHSLKRDKNDTVKRLKRAGISIQNNQKIENFLLNVQNPLKSADIVNLLSFDDPALSIVGLRIDTADHRRKPRLWPGSKETPQSFWDLFTYEAWKMFSYRMLTHTIELLEELQGLDGIKNQKIAQSALPFLQLPDIQSMLIKYKPSSAIDALNGLRNEIVSLGG